ncbi:hypothetical protein GCM10027418_05230 [Mariniluteicoccus endophyticus]
MRTILRGAAVCGCGALGLFQLGLAAGAPWGAASYGGAHPGTLPTHLRVASGIAAGVYAALTLGVATDVGSDRVRRVGLTALAALMAGGTVLNAISPSAPERVWSPVCALIALGAWLSRPARRDR